jgi:hypothetical protein
MQFWVSGQSVAAVGSLCFWGMRGYLGVRNRHGRALTGTLWRLAVIAAVPVLCSSAAQAQTASAVIDLSGLGDVLPPVTPPGDGASSDGNGTPPIIVPPVTVPPVTIPPVTLPPLPVIDTPEGGLPIVRLPLPGCVGDIAGCLPGTVLNLQGLPANVINLVRELPGEATGLLLRETAALSQVVNGVAGTVVTNLTNVVLDLGLVDAAGGGFGASGVVSSPFVAGTTAAPLSMFMVSGVTRLSHDGFNTSSALGNGTTPDFDETDAGLTLGVRWDASRQFDLAPNTFTFGVVGNYTHTDIDVGTNAALAPFIHDTGSANVDSWSAGTFGLLTDGRKYALVTVNATFGAPETKNLALGSTAEYDTFGIAASAMSGVLIPVGRATLDLRGGFTFVSADGDNYTDSAGVHYRNAELEDISGQISARLFQAMKLDDGTARPFIQGGLTQRLHYSNEVNVEGVNFSFDDADTTVFARAGVDFDINHALQAYLAVRGDVNESSEAIAGQVGLTFKLD